MIIDTIKKVLSQSKADAWSVTDTKTHGWEFYFIRHRLDQNRSKAVEHLNVTVYRKSEDGQFLGSASAEVYPTSSEEEIRKTVDSLLYRASLVKNPYYTLNKGDGTQQKDEKPVDVEKISQDFITTLSHVPETKTEDINSYEIFVDEIREHYMNSEGVDTFCVYPSSSCEVVINARDDRKVNGKPHEIELYRMYHSGTCDTEGMTADLIKTMQYGRDKLIAGPTPPLKHGAVVFSTYDAASFVRYLEAHTSGSLKYMGIARTEIGSPFAEDVRGDKITLKAVRYLPNSSRNMAFDHEGAAVHDTVLIDQGIVRNLWSDRQHACYLGLENTNQVTNLVLEGGSRSAEQIRTGTYLEVVQFSSFTVDPMDGLLAGEIRLGYYHDGDKVSIVSGGSVTGNFAQAMKEMYLSREQTQYNNVLVPSVIRLENLTITGIEA